MVMAVRCGELTKGSGAKVRLITRDNLALTQHPRAVIRWALLDSSAG
jgi:hypothetical protein